MRDAYTQDWHSVVTGADRPDPTTNKLRTYATFKSVFEIENYLLRTDIPPNCKRSFARLRIGSHRLEIELGRYTVPKTDIERRICKQCASNQVEDEIHLVMDCSKYADARRVLTTIAELQYPGYRYLLKLEKFQWLMSDSSVAKATASFVNKCFTLRQS